MKKIFKWLLNLPLFQKPKIKALVLHLSLSAVLGLMMAMLMRKISHIDPIAIFILLAAVFLLGGYFHVRSLYQFHPWARRRNFWNETGLTLAVNALLAVFFAWALLAYYSSPLAQVWIASTLFVSLPYLIERAIYYRRAIPPLPVKGVIINNLQEAKGKLSFNEQTKKFLKIRFIQDSHGYLPKEAFIPVVTSTEKLSLADILKALILFNNHNQNQEQPIKLIEEKERVYFKWHVLYKELGLKSKHLSPQQALSAHKLRFRKTQLVEDNGHVRHIDCVEVQVYRSVSAEKAAPKIKISNLKIVA